jgi:threonine dehydrogenase-like Zn-dependent dehydrogenase
LSGSRGNHLTAREWAARTPGGACLPLEQAARGYEIFQNKEDSAIKVVLQPGSV